jgi:mono/diheme cytochrome c family protein
MIGHMMLAAAVFALSAMGSVKAQEIGQPQKGRVLAQQLCAECHAVQKRQAPSPNPSAPRFVTIAAVPGMSSTALYAALQTSHRLMPNVILDSNQMTDIVAYILTLRDGG